MKSDPAIQAVQSHPSSGVVISERLGQRVQGYTRAIQITDGCRVDVLVATKAAEGVDEHDVERTWLDPGIGEHLLEDGTVLICAGGSGLDVLRDALRTILMAPRLCLRDLIGD